MMSTSFPHGCSNRRPHRATREAAPRSSRASHLPLLGAVVLVILFEQPSELLRCDSLAEQVTNPVLDEVRRIPGWSGLVVHTVKLAFLVSAMCRLRLVEQVRELTLFDRWHDVWFSFI